MRHAPTPKVVRKCLNCATEISVYRSNIRKGGGKYCSRTCYGKHSQLGGGKNWRGGEMTHKDYVLAWAPKHPNQVKGYVPKHRLVMERKIGRFLTREEVVHHKNHDRSDNRLRNLELMSRKDHLRHHRWDRGAVTVHVEINGKRVVYQDAVNALGINRSSFFDMRKRHGWTHQQTLDHYLSIRGDTP